MPHNNYNLGGVFHETKKGVSAKPVLNVNRENERGTDRSILRKAMGFSFLHDKPYTPFKMNQNVVPFCGADGSNHGSPPCKGEMGNPKYVNDSSDYIRFKKLSAKNRNYNDSSFGGDDSSAAQSTLRMRY